MQQSLTELQRDMSMISFLSGTTNLLIHLTLDAGNTDILDQQNFKLLSMLILGHYLAGFLMLQASNKFFVCQIV